MSIQDELNQIKNAVYGKDVRDAIHDGVEKGYNKAEQAESNSLDIKQTYDEVLMNWESDPNKDPEVIAARGGLPQLEDRLNETDAQLAHIEAEKINKSHVGLYRKKKSKLTTPTLFGWQNAPINIYKNAIGEITTDFDVSIYKHVGQGKTYYVDVKNGRNTNDGLTPETAFKGVLAAIQQPDVDIVMIYPGVYSRNDSFYDAQIERNMSLIAIEPGTVQITTHVPLPWVKTTGKTNVYQATRSLTYAVYDSSKLDENGDYYKLEKVSSIDEVDQQAGSWYIDSSNVVYVHTHDKRPADEQLRPYTLTNNCNVSSVLYIEGIHLEGGLSGALRAGQGSKIYAKDCSFKYANGNGGYQIAGAIEVYSQNCVNARNEKDGFNYSPSGEHIPKFIEVGCIGRNNGVDNNDNGTTAHGGITGIRVNGDYHGNFGPNVADVNEGTSTWNIGCVSHNSHLMFGYQITRGQAWYDSCISYDNAQSDLYLSGSANAYVANSILDVIDISSGIVTNY